jgi:hypothetical protein
VEIKKKKIQLDDMVTIPAYELFKYIEGYERYQYVRKLNPTTFYELYKAKTLEQITFDDVVDILRKETDK